MNDIKEELNKWRDIPYLWIVRIHIVKMLALSNFIYKFNAILMKIPASYFVDIDKLILRFIWKGKRLRVAYIILKGKNRVGRLALFDFKT